MLQKKTLQGTVVSSDKTLPPSPLSPRPHCPLTFMLRLIGRKSQRQQRNLTET